MLLYPVKLIHEKNSVRVEFPDIAFCNAAGDDEDEALLNAVDALETAFDMYFDDRKPIPLPSPLRRGQRAVRLPTLTTAKVLLWNDMLAQGLRKADLAKLLNVHMPQIDRLFDVRHSTRLDFLEKAAQALGKALDIGLVA